MRIFEVKSANEVIPIGRQGENDTTEIRFPKVEFQEQESGAYELLHKRPTDDYLYPCVITVEEDYISWVIKSADVAKVGNGQAQLSYYVNGVKDKSVIFVTLILQSMTGGGTVPEPYQDWVDDVIEAGAAATTSAQAAAQSAEDAAESAEAAETSATNAATSEENASGYAETAETAKGASIEAKEAAETAQTAAETAQSAAETAEVNASSSALSAAGSATNAQNSATASANAKTAAESARDTAVSAKNDAVTAKEAAVTAKTAAEAAKNAAVQAKVDLLNAVASEEEVREILTEDEGGEE